MHIGRLKHIDVAYLWMQDEIRSKRLRVRRVKSEEHVIAKHGLTFGHVNLAEESGECQVQGVAMFLGLWFHPNVRDGCVRTVCTQNTAGDHVKESSQRTSSRNGRNIAAVASGHRAGYQRNVCDAPPQSRALFRNIGRHHREEGWRQEFLRAARQVLEACNLCGFNQPDEGYWVGAVEQSEAW